MDRAVLALSEGTGEREPGRVTGASEGEGFRHAVVQGGCVARHAVVREAAWPMPSDSQVGKGRLHGPTRCGPGGCMAHTV